MTTLPCDLSRKQSRSGLLRAGSASRRVESVASRDRDYAIVVERIEHVQRVERVQRVELLVQEDALPEIALLSKLDSRL